MYLGIAFLIVGLGATVSDPMFSLGPFSAAERPVQAAERSPVPSTTVPPTTSPPTTVAPIPTPPSTVDPAPTPAPQQNWAPTAIRVPKIGVDAPIDPMGVDENQALEVPVDTTRVGWWSGGAEPGEIAPSVLVGHVDSYTGPAVFFGLDKLTAGDIIEVDRKDGTTAKFAVDRLESYPKTEFATDAVYGATPWPNLRLITCFGPFDETVRSYEDNLVVYASLVG